MVSNAAQGAQDVYETGETFIGQRIDDGRVWNVAAVQWSDGRTTYVARHLDATRRWLERPRIDIPYARLDAQQEAR